MAIEKDAWTYGLIAAPAAGDHILAATGAGLGGHNPRGDFMWKTTAGNFEAQTSAGKVSIAPYGSVSGKLLSSGNLGFEVGSSSAHDFMFGGTVLGKFANATGTNACAFGVGMASNPQTFANYAHLQLGETTGGPSGGSQLTMYGNASATRGYLEASATGFRIATSTNNQIIIRPNAVDRWRFLGTGGFEPAVDNNVPFASASNRPTQLFAVTGTIGTCDIRFKTFREASNARGLTEAEHAAALECFDVFGFFQWNDAIEAKGPDGARWHYAPGAQDVWNIFASHGLADPLGEDGLPPEGSTPPAFLCFDTYDEERAPVMEGWRPSAVLDADGLPIMVKCAEGEEATEQRPTGEIVVTRAAGNIFGIRIDQLHSLMLKALDKERRDLTARVATLEPEGTS